VFEAIPPLCQKTSAINEVFSSPDTVMTKLVLNIYQGKLQVINATFEFICCHTCMLSMTTLSVRDEQ